MHLRGAVAGRLRGVLGAGAALAVAALAGLGAAPAAFAAPTTGGYAVTLAASTTTAAAGTPVTLTATANQDVGPTPYGLSIVDTTTGALVAHASSGTTLTATVTQTNPDANTYVGEIDTRGGAPVAATSTPLTLTWTATAQVPAIVRAATFPLDSESPGDASIAVDPQRVGDLLVLSMQLHSTSLTVLGVSGGGGGTWERAERFVDTANTLSYEVWYAVAVSAGPATIRLTYSAPTSLPVELVADSFTDPAAVSWHPVTGGGSSNPASPLVNWPGLTSGPASLQLYWGASEEHSTGTGVSTPGFVASDTANGNELVVDPSLSPSVRYAPVGSDSPSDVSTAVGVIFSAD